MEQRKVRAVGIDLGTTNSAAAELKQNIDNLSARDIISWWSKWHLKTGLKRLGRILVAMGKTPNK